MERCKISGRSFKASNQVACNKCRLRRDCDKGLLVKKIDLIAQERKKAADESGNPRIWTAIRYSQIFLRSLIPAQ